MDKFTEEDLKKAKEYVGQYIGTIPVSLAIQKIAQALRDERNGLEDQVLHLNEFNVEAVERIKGLEAENEKLNRALRIESSEPEERSQEANHYNWLDDKNEELTAENARLKAELEAKNGN